MKIVDMTGKKFGRWTVIDYAGLDKSGHAVWKCLCECGNVKDVRGQRLRDGESQSCGCLAKEITSIHNSKHNGSFDRLYTVWSGMKARCENPSHCEYHRYGGRGISICDEWKNDYTAFREWALAQGYDPSAPKGKCTLDRIDNDNGYSPQNCTFSDMKKQCNNRHNNVIIECKGESHTIRGWSDITGISYSVLYSRIKNGWDVNRALSTPTRMQHANRTSTQT